jgi:hypothetical protein
MLKAKDGRPLHCFELLHWTLRTPADSCDARMQAILELARRKGGPFSPLNYDVINIVLSFLPIWSGLEHDLDIPTARLHEEQPLVSLNSPVLLRERCKKAAAKTETAAACCEITSSGALSCRSRDATDDVLENLRNLPIATHRKTSRTAILERESDRRA